MILLFGKHKGKEVAEVWRVDPDYLRWAVGKAGVLKDKPFLRDHVLEVMKNPPAAPTPTPADARMKAELAELAKLRAENLKLSCDAAQAARDRAEVERLKREVEDLELSLSALRRSQAKGGGGGADLKNDWTPLYRKLSTLAHPDRGGNAELMAILNAFNAKVK